MNWEFAMVIGTITAATVVLSVTWTVLARIRADTKRRFLQPPPPPPLQDSSSQILAALSGVEERLRRLEDRQDFTEKLLERPSEADATKGRAG